MELVLGVDACNTSKTTPLPLFLVIDEASKKVNKKFKRSLPNAVKGGSNWRGYSSNQLNRIARYIQRKSDVHLICLTPREVNGSSVEDAQANAILDFLRETPNNYSRIAIDSIYAPKSDMEKSFTKSVKRESGGAKVICRPGMDNKEGLVKASHWEARHFFEERKEQLVRDGFFGVFVDKRYSEWIDAQDPRALVRYGLCLWPKKYKRLYE